MNGGFDVELVWRDGEWCDPTSEEPEGCLPDQPGQVIDDR